MYHIGYITTLPHVCHRARVRLKAPDPSSFKAAARATATKDRRGYIRLSSGDLSDIQVKALEEGVPYQTLIASVLHKYVTGRLAERPVPRAKPRRSRASQRQSPTDD